MEPCVSAIRRSLLWMLLAISIVGSQEPCSSTGRLPYEEKRFENVTGDGYLCDIQLTKTWYRPNHDLIRTCPPGGYCSTVNPAWLSGSLPSVSEGVVTRTVCIRSLFDCCNTAVNIRLKNCGQYRVYELPPLPTACPVAYCIASSPTLTFPPTTSTLTTSTFAPSTPAESTTAPNTTVANTVTGNITSPDITAPNNTTSNVTNPNTTTSDVTTPNTTTSDATNSNTTTSDVTTPNTTTSDATTSNTTTSDITTPNTTTSITTTPNTTISDVATPNTTISDITTPNITSSDITTPNITSSDTTTSNTTTSDTTNPNTTTSDTTNPNTTTSNTTNPNTTTSNITTLTSADISTSAEISFSDLPTFPPSPSPETHSVTAVTSSTSVSSPPEDLETTTLNQQDVSGTTIAVAILGAALFVVLIASAIWFCRTRRIVMERRHDAETDHSNLVNRLRAEADDTYATLAVSPAERMAGKADPPPIRPRVNRKTTKMSDKRASDHEYVEIDFLQTSGGTHMAPKGSQDFLRADSSHATAKDSEGYIPMETCTLKNHTPRVEQQQTGKDTPTSQNDQREEDCYVTIDIEKAAKDTVLNGQCPKGERGQVPLPSPEELVRAIAEYSPTQKIKEDTLTSCNDSSEQTQCYENIASLTNSLPSSSGRAEPNGEDGRERCLGTNMTASDNEKAEDKQQAVSHIHSETYDTPRPPVHSETYDTPRSLLGANAGKEAMGSPTYDTPRSPIREDAGELAASSSEASSEHGVKERQPFPCKEDSSSQTSAPSLPPQPEETGDP